MNDNDRRLNGNDRCYEAALLVGGGGAEVHMMTYEEWLPEVPQAITRDPLWRMEAYRLAEYLAYLAFIDTDFIAVQEHRVSLADQLYRATASISANLAEGYGDSSDRDRGRFYRYALRSARESRGWFFKARPILGVDVVQARMNILESIIRLLTRTITNTQGYSFKEDPADYDADDENDS